MQKQSKAVPVILYVLSGFFALLGAAQLVLTVPPSLQSVQEYIDSGMADQAQIDQFYRLTFLPQTITYVVAAFGIAAILLAAGLIYSKLNKIGANCYCAPVAEMPAQVPYAAEEGYFEPEANEVLDDMFADAEDVAEPVTEEKAEEING